MTPLAKKARTKKIIGTCYMGEITTDYNTLVEKFGKPGPGDDYKVEAHWSLEFSGGIVATIYDYKIGVHYLGSKEGIQPQANTIWHIGGRKEWAVRFVHAIIKEPTVRKVKIRLLKTELGELKQ